MTALEAKRAELMEQRIALDNQIRGLDMAIDLLRGERPVEE